MKGLAEDDAKLALANGEFDRAILCSRIAVAFALGEPGFRPPGPFESTDIYTVLPLVMAQVQGGRHEEALVIIDALLRAPDRDVRKSVMTALGARMSDIARGDSLAATEAFAQMGLAVVKDREAEFAEYQKRFNDELRIIANQRARDAVPKQLAPPRANRLTPDQRSAADSAFAAGIMKFVADDRQGAVAQMQTAAGLYALAWENLPEIPDTQIGRFELGLVIYELVKSLEMDADPGPLELAQRLQISVDLTDPDKALDSNSAYELAQLGRTLIRLNQFDMLADLTKTLQTSSDEQVRIAMVAMMTDAARTLELSDQLATAEGLARTGIALFSDAQSKADGYTAQFNNLLNRVLEQQPEPQFAETLGEPLPGRLPIEDKQRADMLFAQAVQAQIANDQGKAQPMFLAAAEIYKNAWPMDIAIPEYRLYQFKLISAAQAGADTALQSQHYAQAEIAYRFAESVYGAHAPTEAGQVDYFPFDGQIATRIALLHYRMGEIDAARSLLDIVLRSQDPRVIEEPASAFNSEVYGLSEAGRLNQAEAAARFGLELYRGKTGVAGYSYARLARSFGEVLGRKNQPDLATEWLMIGWQQRDPSDAFETERTIGLLIGNLLRRGRIDEARPLIVAQAGGPEKLGLVSAKWLFTLADSPISSGTVPDRLAIRLLAMQLLEQTPQSDAGVMIDALNDLGYSQFAVGNFAKAEQLYRRALALSEKAFGLDTGYSSFNIQGLAASLQAQGRVDEAEAIFRRYWQIAKSHEVPDPDSFLGTLRDLLNLLLGQGKLAEADALTAQALQQFQSTPGLAPEVLAGFEADRGRVLLALGRGEEAENMLRRAVGRSANPYTQSTLVAVLEKQGKAAEAEPLIRSLLDQLGKDIFLGAYSPTRLGMEAVLAQNLAAQGKSAQADMVFVATMDSLSGALGTDNVAFADFAESYARHLLTTDRVAEARKVADMVLIARIAARDRTDASASDITRIALARDESRAAALLLRILTRDRQSADPAGLDAVFDAMQRSETSAAGVALARSATSEAAERIGAGDAVAAWRTAQSRLQDLDQQITEAAAAGPAGDAARQAASVARNDAETALSRAQSDLTDRFPRFFDLVSSQPLKLADLQGSQGLLRADEALVMLSPGSLSLEVKDQIGLVLVITREAAAWTVLPMGRGEFTGKIDQFHRTLDTSGATDAAGFEPPANLFSRADSFALYQALFGSPQIAPLLAGKSQWTLAPQGVLASLPFTALVVAAPPGGAAGDVDPAMLRQTRWLGLEKALAVTPSVSVIAIQRRFAAKTEGGTRTPFFGLGDPAFKGIADPPLPAQNPDTQERGTRRTDAVRGAGVKLRDANAYVRGGATDIAAVNGLGRLTGTAGEIRALAEQFGVGNEAIVLQLDASEAEIRRRNANGSLRQTDVIAFATHGLLAGELAVSAVEPALALSPPLFAQDDEISQSNDGLLTASEAALLNLSARFVILSACNTAASGKPDADSLSGLARAFFYAGAQSLLVSHYYVYDSAAPLLTGKAIQFVNDDKIGTAEAMRRSMASLAADTRQDAAGESFAHPKAWAPFAVIDAN